MNVDVLAMTSTADVALSNAYACIQMVHHIPYIPFQNTLQIVLSRCHSKEHAIHAFFMLLLLRFSSCLVEWFAYFVPVIVEPNDSLFRTGQTNQRPASNQ